MKSNTPNMQSKHATLNEFESFVFIRKDFLDWILITVNSNILWHIFVMT